MNINYIENHLNASLSTECKWCIRRKRIYNEMLARAHNVHVLSWIHCSWNILMIRIFLIITFF